MNNNPIENYPDFVIRDISSSYAQQNQFMAGTKTVGYMPINFTIDGPLSLKRTSEPYTLTVSKVKER